MELAIEIKEYIDRMKKSGIESGEKSYYAKGYIDALTGIENFVKLIRELNGDYNGK